MRIPTLAAAALVAVLLPAPTQAQQTVARSYSFVPLDGMSAQFEAALKAHLEWRVENGDPWTWSVSTLEVGEGLGEYGLRTSGHTWADMESYDLDFSPKGLQHYRATVAPLVKSVSSMITTTNEEMSNRPPTGTALAFVTITTFHVRPGRQAEFAEAAAVASQALKDAGWPGHWVWATPLSGGGMGPFMQVVALHERMSDMAEPEPPMLAVLAQAMGQNAFDEWLSDFSESTRGQETIVRRLRPDLSGR